MNSRHASRWFWPALLAVFLTMLLFAHRAATAPQDPAANVKNANGLTIVTFTVKPGTITVNFPDDLRAGDTISGTVVAAPKGNTKEEQAANQAEIKKMGIKLFTRADETPQEVVFGDLISTFKYAMINDRPSGTVLSVGLHLIAGGNLIQTTIPVLPLTPSGAVITPDPKISAPKTSSGAVITPDPKITTPPGMTQSGAVITPNPKTTPTFTIPPLGQTGRSIVITGPFDGDSSNTSLLVTGDTNDSRDSYYGTIPYGNAPLGESPRMAVFQAPNNVTGPIEIKLKEAGIETKGTYRNVGVNLTAPKTSLLKGESTELHVEVNGLQGLKSPVPLTLESHGVITMVGGNYQPLVIQPSQVGPDGRFTTTRGITGIQTGGWTATATVVTHKFDICLQDDTAPARRILWNTFNGDYIFTCPTCWPPKSQPGGGGTTGESGGTRPPVDPNNPPGGLTGTGKMIRKGCIITLQHNAPDRRVFATLDSCATSGTSTVEEPKTKVKFTITDRNIADNTCPSQ